MANSWNNAAMTRLAVEMRVGIALVLCASPAFALDPKRSLTQYIHTSWTHREGINLPSVAAIAQTPDGYLWLGTGGGLYRFDGMRFLAWKSTAGEQLPSNEIVALQSDAQGSLWIGTRTGVSRLAGRRLANYTNKNGLPAGNIVSLLKDHTGGLWVGTAGSPASGLALIRNGTVQSYGTADGLHTAGVLALFEDHAGKLWVGGGGLCGWTPGQHASCGAAPAEVVSVEQDTDGSLLVGDVATRSVFRLSGGTLKPVIKTLGATSLTPKLLLRDSDGNIWLGTLGQGLLRLHDGKLERFTRRDGLSSDVVEAIFEDGERNLWVGTANGLDRFRNPKVARFSTLEGLSSDLITAVHATPDGGIWVGTAGGGLDRYAGGKISHYQMGAGLPSTTVLALHEDVRGRLWAGTTGGLTYLSNGRFRKAGVLYEGKPLDRVFAMAEDARDDLWLADARRGLLRFHNGRMEGAGSAGVPDRKDIYCLERDRRGGLWIGYYGGGVVSINGNAVKTYQPQDGIAGGRVQSIYDDGRGSMWVGSVGGLSRLREGRWTTWTAQHGLPEGGVQGIIGDDHGRLWLQAATDLLHARAADLDNIPDGAPRQLALTSFGTGNGVRFGSGTKMANPRLTKSRDGLLWFSSDDGVAVVDPNEAGTQQTLPVATVERILLDGKPLEAPAPVELSLRGRELQFEYAALSLASQETVRFRYKLEGLDRNWWDAGTRRDIVYSNLAPGRYRFTVTASNSGGAWNKNAATVPFRVKPYFYQTLWFGTLCVVALGLFVWGIYWLRERQLRGRFQLVLQERARLTRELHDTLLQGFTGVVYQLEAAWRQFDRAPEASKLQLERALDQADWSMAEARQTITFLRMPMLENGDLPAILSAAGNQLTEGTPVVFEFKGEGEPDRLSYDVEWNLYALAREAMNNALKHGHPKHIHVKTAYSADSLRVIIQDDGLGFDPGEAAAKKTRWGLRSMQERANHIGARLNVRSAPGNGTTIEVTMPRPKPQLQKKAAHA